MAEGTDKEKPANGGDQDKTTEADGQQEVATTKNSNLYQEFFLVFFCFSQVIRLLNGLDGSEHLEFAVPGVIVEL